GRVGPDREARHRQSVEVPRPQPGRAGQCSQRAADPPMRTVGRITAIGNGDGCADGDAVIGCARAGGFAHAATRFLRSRVSMQASVARLAATRSLSWPRRIFCVEVSGTSGTNATYPGAL